MIDPLALRRALDRSSLPIAAGGAAVSVVALTFAFIRPAWWPLALLAVLTIPLVIALVARRAMVRATARTNPRLRRALDRLEADGYRVWAGVECGADVADRVVIGPTGVFAIRVEEGAGRLEIGRKDGILRLGGRDAGDLIWRTTQLAFGLRHRLAASHVRVPVHALIVLPEAQLAEGPVDMGNAMFLDADSLGGYIRGCRSELAGPQVDRAARAIDGQDEPAEHPVRPH
jgi:hypothetical protein